MKNLLITSVLLLVFASSCVNSAKPKVVYTQDKPQDSVYKKVGIIADSTYFQVAILPIHLDGSSYLIHPIGYTRFVNNKAGSFASKSRYSGDHLISSNSGSRIKGAFVNIKFQHKDSVNMTKLTEKALLIHSVNLIHAYSDTDQRKLLVYEVNDMDTNLDSAINKDDIEALYISEIDGSNFKKITTDFHEVLDWKTIQINTKLYLKTSMDTNKNGIFDKGDTVNYYYIDLLDKALKVVAYNPLK